VSSATNDSGVRKRGRHDDNPSARGVGWMGGRGRGGRSSWPWSGRARSGHRYHFLFIHVFFCVFFLTCQWLANHQLVDGVFKKFFHMRFCSVEKKKEIRKLLRFSSSGYIVSMPLTLEINYTEYL
jgi:hypothetical protein